MQNTKTKTASWSFLMPSSYTHHVFTAISGEARSTALTQPGSARLSAGLPLLIHVLLPFRRQAAEKTLSGWVHIPAITARLPQLTSLRSFLCERAGCQVSEAPFPFPKPLSSCLPHQQNAGSALQSDHHGDSAFVFQPVALDRSHAALSPAPARQDCKWQDL